MNRDGESSERAVTHFFSTALSRHSLFFQRMTAPARTIPDSLDETAPSTASVVLLVADGARPDTLEAAIDAGHLPAMAQLRAEGGLHTITSVFPSVTGPAYTPFLMGRHPGSIGIPGLRWFDRSRRQCRFPGHSRSYVGHEMRLIDVDLDAEAPTAFELAESSLGALSVIRRGLPKASQIGTTTPFLLHALQTHFRGNVAGWLDIDRRVSAEIIERVRTVQPRFTFAALVGIDKSSHSRGHADPLVLDAMRIVDATVAGIRADAVRDGRWKDMLLCVVSDHGHSPVSKHDDLASLMRELGHRTIAHPWVYGRRIAAAVMVSGNAMAHLYLETNREERPFWPALAPEWEGLAGKLLERPSVDIMLLPRDASSCEVRARGRGSAIVSREGDRYSYRRIDGDPLGLRSDHHRLTEAQAYDLTIATDYPDSLVQIATLASAPRSGDIILSASRDWDFRARFEPIAHVSSHGALHREHMLVPLLCNRPLAGKPRRTVDVMPSALAALDIAIPSGVEGTSFL